jgi:predicted molibdopterin-dependent oxidoreductase YjgC
MPDDLLFEPLPWMPAPAVNIKINGRSRCVPAHFTVTAALLEAGLTVCHAGTASGSPRGPFCMMGVCFDCLVEIDGVPNQQGCMTTVREGICVMTSQGKAGVL